MRYAIHARWLADHARWMAWSSRWRQLHLAVPAEAGEYTHEAFMDNVVRSGSGRVGGSKKPIVREKEAKGGQRSGGRGVVRNNGEFFSAGEGQEWRGFNQMGNRLFIFH